MRKNWISAVIFTLLAVVGFAVTYGMIWGDRGDGDRLVVYCSHDSVYSQEILDRFAEETGIGIDVKFDTEATKSLGLVQLIEGERESPRCDVFWNNEVLGMIRLAEAGCLEPYMSLEAARFSDKFKDTTGLWTGFGGRLRVYLVNLENGDLNPAQIEDALRADDLSGVAIANPLYGTTLTHYAALWSQFGPEKLKAWDGRLRDSGVVFANGNAAVKDLVASGVCQIGFTDTDDAFLAIESRAPVRMEPARLPSGETICIPNTVALIKGSHRPEAAQKLVDYLLSEEIEIALANSRSRQIPLGDLTEKATTQLPFEVKEMLPWAMESIDLKPLSAARAACLDWLK